MFHSAVHCGRDGFYIMAFEELDWSMWGEGLGLCCKPQAKKCIFCLIGEHLSFQYLSISRWLSLLSISLFCQRNYETWNHVRFFLPFATKMQLLCLLVAEYDTPLQIMLHILFYVKFLYCCHSHFSVLFSLFSPSSPAFPCMKMGSHHLPCNLPASPTLKGLSWLVSAGSAVHLPHPLIYISLHLAELEFISHLVIYQKDQGWNIFPFCFHPVLVQGCHHKQLLKRRCGFPPHPQVPSHIST